MTEKVELENAELEAVGTLPQDDVANADAHASAKADDDPRVSDSEGVPPKKRKTRRGKSKRKNVHPYRKSATRTSSSSNNVVKPEAPYNSNRFLIEDHGDLDGIDEEFKKTDQASTSTVTRTRDSSFSADSDGEFYSTPDDEEVFLIKDFDYQYESIQAERLQALSKDELIRDFLLLESKFEILSNRFRAKALEHKNLEAKHDSHREIQRLTLENESLKRENEYLRTRLNSSSGSADSETDSSDTCSSTTSSLSRPESPVDYKHTNGHVDTVKSV
ncbi:PREDICTED: protein HEXIM1-like [Nicrophorus vespilloides]|uniref:Protein HEXIM1-like n=1 Tax=Nicrophorus vespilloides TaxID=110193 RepID=A0ABM1NGG6_NICVS|nr:PREDICTED: protein HEXIM1-like [Nicrophorus vespilloides]